MVTEVKGRGGWLTESLGVRSLRGRGREGPKSDVLHCFLYLLPVFVFLVTVRIHVQVRSPSLAVRQESMRVL